MSRCWSLAIKSADGILWPASDQSRDVTGTELVIEGGSSVG